MEHDEGDALPHWPRQRSRSFGVLAENRTLVLQEVDGLRLDYFVNWAWPNTRNLRSMETAMFRAGEWLKTVHESSFQRYEKIDFLDVVGDLHELIRKKGLEQHALR